MDDAQKPRISALAMAKRSGDYASTAFTVEDVRLIRPAWDGPEAEHFLARHEAQLAHVMLEVGRSVLAQFIAQHEKEASNG
jgi:hypothetical protein